jgi:UDP-N-acetylmuramate dehydrogenase
MLIREQVPLAPLTTMGVGGPARYLLEASSQADVLEAVEFARVHQLPLFVLGGGSNLVVSDDGFNGAVLRIALRGIETVESDDGAILFTAAAGEEWDGLVARTVAANCAGVECLSGIPGSVGGTPVQNVGAYGQEVSNTIHEVSALDLRTLKPVTFSNSDCQFGYRSSRFNTTERGTFVILRVTFRLQPGGKPSLRYADLKSFFVDRQDRPTLAEVRAAVREIRHRKAMLLVPGDEDARSAGSFFKNPVIAQSFFDELSLKVQSQGLELPSYSAGDSLRKLPAAWLVEHAGFAKGYAKGRAAISRRHSLAVVNRGGATASEILALKDEIQQRVFDEFGIQLQPEPVFVGF